MKLNSIFLLIFSMLFYNCEKNDELLSHREFEFIARFSTMVTVGGFVGLAEQTFEIGEIYEGTDVGEKTISIRIAEHSELNEDCPNSWCYQEFLDVPREFLRLVE